MTKEQYIRENWTKYTDVQMARVLCCGVCTIERYRRTMGLHRTRTPGDSNRSELKWLTKAEMKGWYKGTFNVWETDWELSGRTK